ncbi:Acetylornithine deacetylase/Succinyl-diaminopimelate desuccinylase [Labilithrix luteola]|uniref:Acetylornithine deacetylase/Succinyl-diaminopimelate desuccinylase n=1 Tax=Labilithrix luteola TaxID=1391654 RepID=A0A0K1Q6T6_9BACT|nr:M20 family metallopeptidase [Labilithrix luteola]AKV01546.1 Acetylornithine deacetylase/Succinyl-diaminopimelate desuccinylase [Labilithrix luteola]
MTTTATTEQAAKWIAEQSKAIESALAELVEVNSFTENTEGGRKVGHMLGELFAIEGLSSRSVASTKFADHLVFESGGGKDAPRIALVGHLDTVFPPGLFEGFKRDGDLARGPGVLDMKGGLVVVAWALKALAKEGMLPSGLRVVIVADEEVGSPEGQRVIQEASTGAASALVFEAGRKNDLVITRRKGTGAVTATAYGKAAHAGNNHKDGANALWALARFVDRAQQLTNYDRGVTVNVGKVTGGTSKNTVPDEAQALVDLRFETRADAEALVEALRTAASEAAASVPGTRIELEGGVLRHPLERTDASAKLMEAYFEAARASGLGAGEANLIGGGSDASTTGAMGIASIDGLGPRGIGFHTKDEQIEIVTLVQKAQALMRLLASLRA